MLVFIREDFSLQVIKTICDMRLIVRNCYAADEKIGFVNTMGALHQGHLSLIAKAKAENKRVIVTIFVNPAQFEPQEDYARFPRSLKEDLDKLQSMAVDWVFCPQNCEILPRDLKTTVEVEGLTDVLCGKSRPSHFRGVTTVLNKLFNICQPHRAYFSQRDWQKLLVVKKMVKDLGMDITIVPCPTVREKDGLAMSARNLYLSKTERESAGKLYPLLQKAVMKIKKGEIDGVKIKRELIAEIEKIPYATLDYVGIVDRNNLAEITKLHGSIMIALAVFIGETRLIDNIWLDLT